MPVHLRSLQLSQEHKVCQVQDGGRFVCSCGPFPSSCGCSGARLDHAAASSGVSHAAAPAVPGHRSCTIDRGRGARGASRPLKFVVKLALFGQPPSSRLCPRWGWAWCCCSQCPICLDLLERPGITECLHVFWCVHTSRGTGWLLRMLTCSFSSCRAFVWPRSDFINVVHCGSSECIQNVASSNRPYVGAPSLLLLPVWIAHLHLK